MQDKAMLDTLMLTYFEWLQRSDAEQFERVRLARDFYAGRHDVELTARQQEILNLTTAQIESLGNYCELAVDALAERLDVERFDAASPATVDTVTRWWHDEDMSATQDDVHLSALRDGDAYLLVEYDSETQRPRFYHELADDGTNGSRVVYTEERHIPRFAYKRWRIESGEDAGRLRLNLYYSDRFEPYITSARGVFVPYEEEVAEWPVPLVDASGAPIGLPMIHFATNPSGNDYGVSELSNIIPVQRVITMLLVSLISQADEAGFPIRTLSGAKPAPDMALARGALWWSELGQFGSIPAGDLLQVVESLRYVVMMVAQISRVPLTFFQDSKAVASADTVKASESGIVARVRDRADAFALSWRDAMRYAIRLHNVYGSTPTLDDTKLTAVYAPFDTVDPLDSEDKRSTIAQKHITNGLSIGAAYTLAGYSEEEVAVAQAVDTYGAEGLTQ